MQKGPLGSFDIPSEMRTVAEQSVVQARQAFDALLGAATQAASRMEEQTAVAQAGAKGAGQKMMGYAEQNIAASFEFAQKLARAKDMQEIAELQQAFVKAQMATLGEQAKDIGQSVTDAAKAAATPVKKA